MSPPRTSVVIRCLNEEEHIGRLLTGLMRQRRRPDQIVVVDSGSSDATLEIAARFPTDIQHIPAEQFSFGRALNVGFEAATGDVVVMVSAHVYPVHVTWLEDLTAPFERPSVALTYGRQIGDERTRYSEHRLLARWFPAEPDPSQQHPFCNNANAAVRRELWHQWPYDEELTGLEDLAWAKRALAHGHDIAYVASATVVHAHRETFRQVVNRYRREAIAHKAIYNEQGMGRSEAVALAVRNIVGDAAHALRDGQLGQAADIVAFRAAQFTGTWQGFAQTGPVHEELKRRFYYPPAATAGHSTIASGSHVIDYATSAEDPS